MKNLFYIIGFVLTCVLTVTICGCNPDVEDDLPTVDKEGLKTTLKGTLPSIGSTIDPDAKISLIFEGLPGRIWVNTGTLVNVGDSHVVEGPFSGNELTLEVYWDGGSKTLKYFLKVKYIESHPPVGSTLKPRDVITLNFSANPKNVRGVPNFKVIGNDVQIADHWWDPGILEFDIHWEGNIKEAGGKKALSYNVSREPIAYIDKVWLNKDDKKDGKTGIRFRINFTAGNMQNEQGSVNVYFEYDHGTPLKDLNGKFATRGGNVSVWKDFKPRFDVSRYDDFELFIPHSELHLARGIWDVKYKVRVHNKVSAEFIEDESVISYFKHWQ